MILATNSCSAIDDKHSNYQHIQCLGNTFIDVIINGIKKCFDIYIGMGWIMEHMGDQIILINNGSHEMALMCGRMSHHPRCARRENHFLLVPILSIIYFANEKIAQQALRRTAMALIKQKIVPHLWFATEAKEAARFYCSVFPDSKVLGITKLHNTPSGECDVVSLSLSGQSFMAISAGPLFKFNESISFIVKCDTQEEINYYWEQLSAVPESEQCGWLKDRYGLSWQIVPTVLDEMMQDENPERVARITEAFLKMKKFDIAVLHAAYNKK